MELYIMEKIYIGSFKLTKEFLKENERAWIAFSNYLETINEGIEKQEIYNVDYKDANSRLSSIMSDFYSFISIKYHRLRNSGGYIIPTDVADVDNLIMSFNQVTAMDKRLKKCVSINDPFYKEMRACTDEHLELAKVMKELKAFIKKGRKSTETKTIIENPNKIVKTCPCCLRPIAISKENYMVNHGYKRPGSGCLIGNCYGTRFKPLEESLDGVLFMIDLLEKHIKQIEETLEKANDWTEIKKYDYKGKVSIIKKEDPMFTMLKRNKLRELEYDKANDKRSLMSFMEIKNNWSKKD